MNRKEFLKITGLSAGALSLSRNVGPWIARSNEDPLHVEVRVERGGPRLFVNGVEAPPLFGCSTGMSPTIYLFREAGIPFQQPIVGLHYGWTGPESYDWTKLDGLFKDLIDQYPDAYLFPRIHINTPRWWKEAHPDEMIKYGLPTPQSQYDLVTKRGLEPEEGGHTFELGRDLWETSFASDIWRRDTETMLREYIDHVSEGPFRSRILGYFISHGRTAEWNYFGTGYLPDTGLPMERVCGEAPSVRDRIGSTYGLLRDPARERAVIDFYRCFHEQIAETVVHFARVVKDATNRRLLCGTFFAYVTESPRIQEGGYLMPQRVIDSPDIDVLACPYAYQNTNVDGIPRSESDMVDGAGNYLGRARGVGGDGGFRAMIESLHRRGKMYISEIDPSTFLDTKDSLRSTGGSGSNTVHGTLKLLKRDLAKAWAKGVGAWLLDFGPWFDDNAGWFGDERIIDLFGDYMGLMTTRSELDISSVGEICLVCDPTSFFVTRHWLNDKPWPGFGIRGCDLFNHWFLNAQSRSLLRIGSPVDTLYRTDLRREDAARYKLILAPVSYYLDRNDVEATREVLRDSGATVVWYYAPGFVTPDGLSPEQSERLTGFKLDALEEPGPMMIAATRRESSDPTEKPPTLMPEMRFGIKSPEMFRPRFKVSNLDHEVEVLGHWTDRSPDTAFARKQMGGWTSVYVGTAPLPVELLRWLAEEAGVTLWSSQPDVVEGCEDAVAVVAAEDGHRRVTFHKPLYRIGADPQQMPSQVHELDMEMGAVEVFTHKS